MRAFFILGVVFVMAVPVVYAQAAAVPYDDHGKHDPFWPLVSPTGALIAYDSDLTINDMVLEGVVSDTDGKNLAIINGKVVKAGDKLGPYVIELINVDQVNLTKGQEHFSLKLNKGGT